MDAAERLVEYAVGISYEDLPKEAIDAAKKVMLDLSGVIIAGSSSLECIQVLDLVRGWGGKGESSILVFGDRVPSPNAGLVNSVMGRAMDFDDVHEKAVLHPSVSVVPAALAVAELVGDVNGKEFITAVVLGVDLTCRLGMAPERGPNISGMSTTWQCGAFGSAAAAGKILDLNEDELLNALGIAYSQVSGNQQGIIEGATMVRVQQGLTTKAGILSALLARKGVTGPRQVLEGRYGYYPVYHRGEYDRDILLDKLGERFEIMYTSIKPYPCCKWTHQAIDGTLDIVREKGVKLEDVEVINVRLSRQAYNLVCTPRDLKYNPRSVVDAQFSIPFTVASAIVKGNVSLNTFTDEAIKDERIIGIAKKVRTTVDEDIEARYSREIAPEIIEVKTKDGEVFIKCVEHVRGSPQIPMSLEEVYEKFKKCLAYSAEPISDEKAESFYVLVRSLEELEDISSMIGLLTR